MYMKQIAIALLAFVGVAGAQQPTPVAPPVPAASRDTTIIPLDRIIAVVGEQPITQYDVQERMLAMQQAPGFRPPTTQAEFAKLAQ
jgi:hypothetical protein